MIYPVNAGPLQPFQPTYTPSFLSSYVIQGVIDAQPLSDIPLRLKPIKSEAKTVSTWSSLLSWLLSLILISANPNQQLNTTTTTQAPPATTTRASLYNYGCPMGQMGKYCDQCGLSSAAVNLKIVGGTPATPNSYPAQAYIRFNYQANVRLPSGTVVFLDQTFMCGGTLINRNTILTAAHCIPSKVYYQEIYEVPVQTNSYKPTFGSMFTVYLGMNDISGVSSGDLKGGVLMTVSEVYRHVNFDERQYLNDIAILKLTNEVVLSTKIQVACLPDPSQSIFPNQVGTKVYAAGWGTTSFGGSTSSLLFNVMLNYYDGSSCSLVEPTNARNFTNQICAGELAGGKDTCQGDSGGAIYVLDTVAAAKRMIAVGIVSYGEQCGLVNKPGFYTRISGYLNWINQYA